VPKTPSGQLNTPFIAYHSRDHQIRTPHYAMPSSDVGSEVFKIFALYCWPCVRSDSDTDAATAEGISEICVIAPPISVMAKTECCVAGGAERTSLDGMARVRPACRQAGKACSSAHSPNPRDRANDQSTPPPGMAMPEMSCPIRLSSTDCHGTRLNPRPPSPLSIIANRPLDSWAEPTSWPVT
jgi:hypothetical protein